MNLKIKKHYVAEIVKLMLWYVKWLLNLGVAFEDAIQRHVGIYQLTSFYDKNKAHGPGMSWQEPGWKKLLIRLKKIMTNTPAIQLFNPLPNLKRKRSVSYGPIWRSISGRKQRLVPQKGLMDASGMTTVLTGYLCILPMPSGLNPPSMI